MLAISLLHYIECLACHITLTVQNLDLAVCYEPLDCQLFDVHRQTKQWILEKKENTHTIKKGIKVEFSDLKQQNSWVPPKILLCKFWWTTYNSWLAFWRFKGFYWPKARRKRCTKSLIRYFGVLHHQQGSIVYQRQLLLISALLMV